MFYKLIQDEYGNYQDAQGWSFSVASARRVRNKQGINPGYEEFPSLEAALEFWGLHVVPTEYSPMDEKL